MDERNLLVEEQQSVPAKPVVLESVNTAVEKPKKTLIWRVVWAILLVVFLAVIGGIVVSFRRYEGNKSKQTSLVKTQGVNLVGVSQTGGGLSISGTDKVVVNGQLQTNQGLVLVPTAQPVSPTAGQIYLDNKTNTVRYYNGTKFVDLAVASNTKAPTSLTTADVLALIAANGVTLPQPLGKTAAPQFAGLNLSSTNGNIVHLQASATSSSYDLVLPGSDGTASQCLTTDGGGNLTFSDCVTGSGSAFVQGGNSFGTTASIGTNDANGLNLLTNGTAKLTIDSGGDVSVDGSTFYVDASGNAVGFGTLTPGNKLSVNTATTAVANAQVLVSTGGVNNHGLVVQGVPSQVADLLDVQSSDGSSLFTITGSGQVVSKNSADFTNAFDVQNSLGSSVFNVDTQNNRVGVNNASPNYAVDVVGSVNLDAASQLLIGGQTICDISGCGTSGGSGFYIHNGVSVQTTANFAIQSKGAANVTGVLRGTTGQTADVLDVQDVNGVNLLSVAAGGATNITTLTDSHSGFTVQDSTGSSNLFIADTITNQVGIGKTPNYTLDVNGDINIAAGSKLYIGDIPVCDIGGCGGSPAGTYISNGHVTQTSANFNIQSANANYVGGSIQGAVGQTADLFDIKSSSSNNLLSISASGAVALQNASNSTGAFTVSDSSSNVVLAVDSQNDRVGINTASPGAYSLDVNGDANVSRLFINGVLVCSLGGCSDGGTPAGTYIQNQTALQSTANFNIQSANPTTPTAIVRAAAGQSANIFEAQNSAGVAAVYVTSTGGFVVKNSNNTTSGFTVKNAAGTNILNVDTANTLTTATNLQGNGFVGYTDNASSYGVVGSSYAGVGGGVKGSAGGGYGVYGTSALNVSGLFQTSATDGSNDQATLVARANTNQAGNLFEAQGVGGAQTLFSIDSNGSVIGTNASDTTTALQIQNAAGTGLLTVNSSASQVELGTAGSLDGQLAFASSAGGKIILTAGSTASDVNLIVPATAGTYTICTDAGNCLGGSGGGANAALSNLASVAINTTLLPGSNNAIDLGSSGLGFRNGYFSTGIQTNNITPTGSLTVGSTGQQFTLQGNANSVITATGDGFATTVGFTGTATGAVRYNLDRSAAAGTYGICTTVGNCLGGASGAANVSLSNLQSVALNTSLLPGVAGGINIGSGTLPVGNIYLSGSSATPGTNNFLLTGASTGGTRTLTLPDASGTICISSGNCLGGSGGGANTALSNLSSVAINTALLPGSNNAIDLGSAGLNFRNGYLGGNLSLGGNFLQSGAGTFGTGTGAVSLNGDTTIASGKNLSVAGGTLTSTGGAINLNATGTASTSIGNATGTLALTSNAFSVTTLGAVSGVTGYAQSSGNFLQSGAGTFGTGTGAVSLNGNTTVASGKTLGLTTLGNADSATYLCKNSSNIISTCSTGLTGSAFIQGGNDFGSAGTLGLTGNNTLNLITNNTTRFSISGSGNSTFSGNVAVQNSSTNALQVQNGTGAQLFNVDTSNSVITINGANSGELQTWSTSSLGATRTGQATVSDGSYIYVIGGLSSGTITDAVSYAPINANGSLGSWTSTTGLGAGNERKYVSAAVYNGYMYVVGGFDSANNVSGSVFYGKINSNGTITSWTQADNKINTARGSAAVVAYNGYLYVMGGATSWVSSPITPSSAVEYARLGPDGSVGAFSTGTSLSNDGGSTLQARMGGRAVAANGYMYFVGGQNSTPTAQTGVYKAAFPNDGTGALGSWTTAGNSLNVARSYEGVGVANGYLYAVGGGASASAGTSSVEYAALNSSAGTIGAFTTSPTPMNTASAAYGNLVISNGYFYVVGGTNGSGTALSTVQYTSGSRLQVATSLDLVGISGQTLGQGGSGGSLTAGNTLIAGTLRVTGDANYLQNMAINGDLSIGGLATFRSSTNSNSAFQIQNASGSSIIAVDTVNNQVQAGTSATSTVESLSYNTATAYPSAVPRSNMPMILNKYGYPMFLTSASFNDTVSVYNCQNYKCSSRTSITPLINFTYANNNADGMVLMPNGNPIVFFQSSAGLSFPGIMAVKCGSYDCTSGNSSPYAVHSVGGQLTGSTMSVMQNSNGLPFIAWSQVSNNDLYVTSCDNADCTSKTETAAYTTGIAGLSAQTGLSYCSESDRGHGISPNTCPIIASISGNAGSNDIAVTQCTNVKCTASSTTLLGDNTATSSTNNTMQMVVASDGLPFIVREINTQRLEVIECLNLNCSGGAGVGYKSSILVDGVTGKVSGNGNTFNVILGKNGLPLITYKDTLASVTKFLQCGTKTCDPASGLNTVTNYDGTGGFYSLVGNAINTAISGDGLPFYLGQGGGGTLELLRCIDLSCASSSATTIGGGVTIGTKNTLFQGLYTTTINDGIQGSAFPGFSLDHNKLVTANALTSDSVGNVVVSSSTSTAFEVTNANTGTVLLSVDASYNGTSGTNSVNVGTTTSVSGYGFNSAVASLFKNSSNSTSALQIQDAGGLALLNADTTNRTVNINQGGLVIGQTSNSLSSLAAGSNQGGTLSGASGTTYYYKVTAVTGSGETVASSEQSFNGASFTPLTAPTAPTSAASGTSGNVSCNNTAGQGCIYQVTFVTANGETTGGTSSTSLLNVTSKQVNLTNIAVGPTGTTARKIYRSTNGGAFLLDQTIANNTSTTATDNIAAPAGAIPISNTATTNTNNLTVSFTTISGATSYKIYRGTSAGVETAYQTTASSPFTDTGAAGSSATPPSTSSNLTVNGTASFTPATDSATAFKIQNAGGTTTLFNVDTTGNGAVSIQAGTSGTISIGTVNSLAVTIGKSGGSGTLTVNGNSTFNGTLTVAGHIITGGTALTGSNIAAGTDCGTGCTVSVVGNDTAGTITVNTGTSAAAGTQATLTFVGAYVSAPNVTITPVIVPASSNFPQYYYSSTTSTLILKTYNALTDSKTYTFTYQVLQ